MRLLELFSGTGSVSKAVGDRFSEIVSIDILDQFNPTITTDILTWDYKVYPPNHFDVIWASPPCTEYSRAKTRAPRNLELADSIVKRTLEIIEYFKPKTWYMENPQTGLLKSRPFMQGIPYYTVDYCQYGLQYRKPTAIWTNKVDFQPRVCNKLTCEYLTEDRLKHKVQLGCGYNFSNGGHSKTSKYIIKHDRYRIPEQLVKELFN
jgi:site-specific DNA-cytosine methylase